MDRPLRIAMLTRRFRLLAKPELFGTRDMELMGRLRGRSEAVGVPILDLVLACYAEEVDHVCASAVVALGRPGGNKRAVLDLLGVLDPDRKAALYYALPAERRGAIERAPSFMREVRAVERDMPDALYDAQTLGYLSGDALAEGVTPWKRPDKWWRQVPERVRRLGHDELLRLRPRPVKS